VTDAPAAAPEPESTPEAVDPAAEVAPASEPEAAAAPVANVLPTAAEPKRFTIHFAIVYAGLGVVAAAAVTGLIVLVIKPGYHAGPPWSTWKPVPGTAQKVSAQIADHVARRYRLSENGTQLVAVIPGKPEVTSGTQKISINAIAVRQAPQSNTGIQIYPPTDVAKSLEYTLCGLGVHCSIGTGVATPIRGRLVRREALEIALYTFKFAPTVNSIVAFMTPPPGQTSGDVIYLRKDDLKIQLSQPLSKTLPLATPPLPTSGDSTEAATIDKLTLPHMFTYSLTALQTGGAALILDPAA